MRQVFTSPRLANVEAVAQLLDEAGIANKISNGRSYRGRFDRGVSYREGGGEGEGEQAAVWVLRSEDQPRARDMLREAGLLDSTRPDRQRDSFLPDHLRAGAQPTTAARGLSPGRLKLILLIGIVGVMAMVALWQRRPAPAAVAAAPTVTPVAQGPTVLAARSVSPVVQRVDVPSALAALLLARAGSERGMPEACVRVDDATPGERTVALAAQAGAPALAEAARCGDGTALPRIDIHEYMTDGSGSGTVRMHIRQGAMRVDQHFEVQRDGHDWRITGSSRR